ncbi:MAG: arginase [Candidatus Xenobiia bacterium LiM19]
MTITIIGVPIDLGANRRGVDMGPSALRIAGLSKELRELGYSVNDLGDLPVKIQERQPIKDPSAKYLPEIARVSSILAKKVAAVLMEGGFPLVLGGDHSIAIGTVAGIGAFCQQEGRRPGILWVDAHGDFNTPESSPSGNIHGMAAAICAGIGPSQLCSIGSPGKKVEPENIVMIGLRNIDRGERECMMRQGVKIFTMEDIDRRGMHQVMKEALLYLCSHSEHIHVSFDLDSVDPLYASGVGTPVRGGLTYREAQLMMEMIAETERMASLEVVEVNPILDTRNQSAILAVELIHSAFGKTIL